MNQHAQLFENIRKRTGMYTLNDTYESVASFVLGYDAAHEGGTLMGFREWLVLRLDFGDNLGWPALVPHIAFPKAKDPWKRLGKPAAERHAIETMFDLIAEFDGVRSQHEGLKDIFLAFGARDRL
jgi:hypothetical protein